MKTIEVTDSAARTIEALRDDNNDTREVIHEQLCKAFAAVGDRIGIGENNLIPALSILSEYNNLIKELAEEED